MVVDWSLDDENMRDVPNIKNTLSMMNLPKPLVVEEPWQNYKSKNVCFFDVETTGLSYLDYITTAVLYSDKKCFYFVKNVNLHLLPEILKQFDICVTYYGRHFDIPMFENEFGTFPIQCRIDLERIYGKIGFRGGRKGGLKGLEDAFLPLRKNKYHITGSQAPSLWKAYNKKTNPILQKLHYEGHPTLRPTLYDPKSGCSLEKKALTILLSYNFADSSRMKWLMNLAYSFLSGNELKNAPLRQNPFEKLLKSKKGNCDARAIEIVKSSTTITV